MQIHFQDGSQGIASHSSTTGSVFGDFAQLGRLKSTNRPNFGDISLCILEFYIRFPFSSLRRQRHVVLSYFIHTGPCEYLSKSYDIISIFQDGGQGIAISWHSTSGFVFGDLKFSQDISVHG